MKERLNGVADSGTLADPFCLDGTVYAAILRRNASLNEFRPEPPHPLLADGAVAKVTNELRIFTEQTKRARDPQGTSFRADPYFDDDGALRYEVIARIVIDCLREPIREIIVDEVRTGIRLALRKDEKHSTPAA